MLQKYSLGMSYWGIGLNLLKTYFPAFFCFQALVIAV